MTGNKSKKFMVHTKFSVISTSGMDNTKVKNGIRVCSVKIV